MPLPCCRVRELFYGSFGSFFEKKEPKKLLRQHRIILSADAASEKYKLLSKKRR